MQFSTVILAALAAVTPVSAFTNGTLVPAYICNQQADGLPKSFGQLLPYTRKNLAKIAVDAKAGDNKAIPLLAQTGGQKIGNSAYILASFHNSLNSLNSIQQGLKVTTANGGPIVAGQANQLVLANPNKGQALGGALLYASDGTGQRQGTFTDKGANTFVTFPGCGVNAQGTPAGVIQQQGISATGTYNQLFYNAPATVSGNITLSGLSVTANGFGVWTYTFPVSGGTGATGGTGGTAGNTTGATTGATGATGGKGGKGKTTTKSASAVAAPAASSPAAAVSKGQKAKAGTTLATSAKAPCSSQAAPAAASPPAKKAKAPCPKRR